MSNNLLYMLDKDIRDKCRSRSEQAYHRTVDGDEEKIKYLSGSFFRAWYNIEPECFPKHWHYALEVVVPLENSLKVIIQNDEYNINPGDIIIIPAGELHEMIVPKTGSRLVLLLNYASLSHLTGFSALAPILSQPIFIPKDEENGFYNHEIDLIGRIFMEYTKQPTFTELTIYSIVLDFLISVGRYKLLGENESVAEDAMKQQELGQKLAIAFDYIDSHYTEEITLEDVAFVAGFSKFHFSRLFKQCSGRNFHEYLVLKRIKVAELLLMKQELSITEIALQAGFSSLSTFNRTFKNIKGCSPTEYRALCSRASRGLS